MGIIDFISDTPANDGRMIPIPPDPGGYIPFYPFIKETCIVIISLRPFPHVKALRENQHAGFIGKLHHFLRRHVVGRSDGIHTHLT